MCLDEESDSDAPNQQQKPDLLTFVVTTEQEQVPEPNVVPIIPLRQYPESPTHSPQDAGSDSESNAVDAAELEALKESPLLKEHRRFHDP